MSTLTNVAAQDSSLPKIRHTARVVEIGSLLMAAVLATFYLVSSIYIASHRLFWFDEIFTVHLARLPHWTAIWTALAHATDSQPPIYYLVVRVFDQLLGHNDIAIRLPSALAMAAGLLLTFDCARRLTDGPHGLIALAVLPCSFLPYYGYEARPYGIYFMLAALALWVWTYNGKGKWLPAIFFGTTFLLGATIHYYFGLCLVPYALWEATRWRPWKPPSAKLIAGTVGAIVPVAIFSPLIVAFSNQFRQTFWGHPSVWLLGKVFSDVFPSGLVLLALVMVWVTLVGAEDKTIASPPMQPGEAVGWLFLCIPLAGFVVAYKTNAFADRYLIGTLPGIAVAFACWIWRGFRNASLVSAAIFLLLTTWGLANQLKIVEHPEVVDRAGQQTVTRRNLTLEGRLLGDGKRFILFSDAMVYLEAQYYFQHPEGCALILAPREEDPDYDSGRLVLNLARYYPLHIWALEDLTKHARETALIAPPPSTLNALDQAGFKAEVRFSEPFRVVYMH